MLALFILEILDAACCRLVVVPFNARVTHFFFLQNTSFKSCRVCECGGNVAPELFPPPPITKSGKSGNKIGSCQNRSPVLKSVPPAKFSPRQNQSTECHLAAGKRTTCPKRHLTAGGRTTYCKHQQFPFLHNLFEQTETSVVGSSVKVDGPELHKLAVNLSEWRP